MYSASSCLFLRLCRKVGGEINKVSREIVYTNFLCNKQGNVDTLTVFISIASPGLGPEASPQSPRILPLSFDGIVIFCNPMLVHKSQLVSIKNQFKNMDSSGIT